MSAPRREVLAEGVELWLGDALEVMTLVRGVDLICTDPPYNFSTSSAGVKMNFWGDAVNSAYWFSAVYRGYLETIGAGRPAVIWQFLNWKTFIPLQKAVWDAGLKFDSMLIWDKEWIGPGGEIGLRPSYEMIAFSSVAGAAIPNRGLPDIWRCKWASARPSGHPAEKPEQLMKQLILASPGKVVCDPFMGSGTTGCAAVRNGRHFIGVEIDERYFDIACRRISEALRQPDLFVEQPKPVAKQEAFL